jgi:hypothetical protein
MNRISHPHLVRTQLNVGSDTVGLQILCPVRDWSGTDRPSCAVTKCLPGHCMHDEGRPCPIRDGICVAQQWLDEGGLHCFTVITDASSVMLPFTAEVSWNGEGVDLRVIPDAAKDVQSQVIDRLSRELNDAWGELAGIQVDSEYSTGYERGAAAATKELGKVLGMDVDDMRNPWDVARTVLGQL